MTQETQKIYDPELLEEYLKDNPSAKNKAIYAYCGAITDSQKGYLRKKKSRLQKRNETQNDTGGSKNIVNKKINSLNETILEKLICDMLNGVSGVKESKVRIAVDFYSKVKTDKGEEIEELDMDGYLKLYDTAEK